MSNVNTQDALSALKSPDIEKPYTILQNVINFSEFINYLIMLCLFVVIIVSNISVFQDLNGSDPSIKNTNVTIQALCSVGILFCFIRICWKNIFTKNKRINHIMELIFGLVIWGLFITVLIFSLRTRNQLNKSTDSPVVNNAKKHNQTEIIVSSIGIGLTSLYTIYNIYNLSVSY